MPDKSKRGFTLIELLVVIAIIALLLSIIVPSLKKAKAHASKVIDKNNLKSLSTAVHIYLTNNNDTFFPYSTSFLWMSAVGKQVDNIDEVRYSPHTMIGIQEAESWAKSNPGTSDWGSNKKPWVWGNSATSGQNYYLGSYGLNGWLYSGDYSFVPDNMKSLMFEKSTAVNNPSRTPVILNSNWVDGWPQSTNALSSWQMTGSEIDSYATGARNCTHGNAANNYMMGRFVLDAGGRGETSVIFMDGSAASVSHAELWSFSWHRGYQPNFNPVLPPR